MDGRRAGVQEGGGALAESRAGREDVVDQEDAPAADARGVADQESAGDLGQTRRGSGMSELARRTGPVQKVPLEQIGRASCRERV